MLTRDQILKTAQLARIELKETEIEKFRQDLSKVLEYVEELKKVNTEGILEVSHVTGLENIQRDDIAIQTKNREAILKNAPAIQDGYYKTKAIL